MKYNRKLKIKMILLFETLFLLTVFSYGHGFKDGPCDHRILSINQGYAFSGSGDCWGLGNEISHLKTIAPILFHRESISSWIINGASWIDDGYESQNGFDLSIELGISPFLMKKRMLSFTAGGCLSYQISRSPYMGGTYYQGGSSKTMVSYRTENLIDPGFTLGLNVHSQVSSRLWLNARAAIRSYRAGGVISIISVGLGFDSTKRNK